MNHGATTSKPGFKSTLRRLTIQGPIDHITSFFCFWKPSIARRITVYFLIFGLIIFLFSTFLYAIAAKRTFLKSVGTVIQGQYSMLKDVSEIDFLLKGVGNSQPEIYRMFGLLSSLSSVHYAVSDVAFYRQDPTGSTWTRIFFGDTDVLQETSTDNPSMQKLAHRLKRRFHRLEANLFKTDGTITMFVNLTGEKDTSHYFLGIGLDSETFTGFIRSQFKLFLLFLFLGMVVSRLLAHIFVRKIAHPIEELSETVSKVAQGDLSHKVSLTSKDEIGQLAADVNTMMTELREWDRIKRIEFELEKGQEIQREFLPRTIPVIPNWEIAAFFQPAGKVSGDFYDVFELPDGHMGLVIGDVCDKGVGSALYMALFRSLIRVFSTQRGFQEPGATETPEKSRSSESTVANCGEAVSCLRAVLLTNEYIAQNHGDEGMFATIFFGVLDPVSGRLHYINGGHEPLLLIGAEGVKESLKPTGPAVGMMPEMHFSVQDICMNPGDILLGYTDGLTEARSADDKLYTRERLNLLFDPPQATAGDLLDRIQSNLGTFTGLAPQNDDITMLAVQRAI